MSHNGSPAQSAAISGASSTFVAADGFDLHGKLWSPVDQAHTALLINPATGVAAKYYSRYASYLAAAGFLVLTYDYRGIGASKPQSLYRDGICQLPIKWKKDIYNI